MVSVGGKELVSSGGVASAPKVLSGGAEDVLTGGVASNANVSGSGKLIVSAGRAPATQGHRAAGGDRSARLR